MVGTKANTARVFIDNIDDWTECTLHKLKIKGNSQYAGGQDLSKLEKCADFLEFKKRK